MVELLYQKGEGMGSNALGGCKAIADRRLEIIGSDANRGGRGPEGDGEIGRKCLEGLLGDFWEEGVVGKKSCDDLEPDHEVSWVSLVLTELEKVDYKATG
jgi:hypothetical protein